MPNDFTRLNEALRTPKQSPWTGKEVEIQMRIKGSRQWGHWCHTADYIAYAFLDKTDSKYEFRIASANSFDEIRKAIK